MFREGRNGNVERKGALYCHFPTPNEDFSMCFYHPGHGVGRELLALKARDKDRTPPNVMEAIRQELRTKGKNKKRRGVYYIREKERRENAEAEI